MRVALGFMATLDGQLSDEVLATRIVQGDVAALETLYDRHAAIILGIALKITNDRILAEDVLQETFWRVWRNAVTYQPQRGSFHGWLFRIARNLAIDAYRRRTVRPQVITEMAGSNSILEQISDSEADVSEQVQTNLNIQDVQIVLTTLPREQRQVIEMAYFHGMTRQEIADATGEAIGTIHTRARLGLLKLRQKLAKSAGFES
jgi:RNA polymerase sigma-70 factor, ECF subfamily